MALLKKKGRRERKQGRYVNSLKQHVNLLHEWMKSLKAETICELETGRAKIQSVCGPSRKKQVHSMRITITCEIFVLVIHACTGTKD